MSLIIPKDDYSPILQGDTGAPFSIEVIHVNGYESILGSDISLKMQNVDDPDDIKECTGPWTIDSHDNGKASYEYQPADVDTPGSWYMWVKIVLSNGKPLHPDDGTGSGKPKVLKIVPLQSGL